MTLYERAQKAAYDVIPSGTRLTSVVALRKRIVEVVVREVEEALRRQREENFPDLAEARKVMAKKQAEVIKERDAVESWRDEIARRERQENQKLQEILRDTEVAKERLDAERLRLNTLVAAFGAYEAYQNGDGDPGELPARYNTLREAYQAYINGTQK